MQFSELVGILEQFVAGEVPTLSHDAGKTPVFDTHVMHLPAFSAEMEAQRIAMNLDVTIAQGGKSVGRILLRVLFVADSNEGRFEEHYDSCDYLFARKILPVQSVPDPRPYLRERGGEIEHAVELRLVANLAVLRVVTILAPPSRIEAGRLQMAVREGAYPDLLPRGWNDEGTDAIQEIAVPDQTAVRIEVREALAAPAATQAWRTASHISQSGSRCGFYRIGWESGHAAVSACALPLIAPRLRDGTKIATVG
jgi:hypothetical protein